jgi:hypothetical protein
LPYLLPLFEHARSGVPYVVAVVDRTGADIHVVNSQGVTIRTGEVRGSEHQVHEVGDGGWSHRSMRSRVEENVRRNLHEVARELARLAAKVKARAVMIGGEVQARAGVLAALPEPASHVAVELTAGSRAAGFDEDALRKEIARALDMISADDRLVLLDSYRGNRGVQGLRAVASALREGNAEAVLINPGGLGERTVWASPAEPTQLAATLDELRELGIGGSGHSKHGEHEAEEQRTDEVIPVAAVAVGAELLVTDEAEPADGVGVLLRYT